MTRMWRRAGLVLALALLGASFGAVTPAGAADVAARVTTFENFDYQPGPGGGLVLNWGFSPTHLRVPSGSAVAFANVSGKQSGEAHTVSVVSRARVPRTAQAVLTCGAPGTVCFDILKAHDPNGDQKPPFDLLVNKGRAGLDRDGDSRLLLPGATAYARVTAPAGTTLHYICAIHAWMQATITVT